jgi:hypothetical protein
MVMHIRQRALPYTRTSSSNGSENLNPIFDSRTVLWDVLVVLLVLRKKPDIVLTAGERE